MTEAMATGLARKFTQLYGGVPELFSAPARVNIIGEHTDYNQGLVFPIATALYTRVAISGRSDRVLNIYSENIGSGGQIALDAVEMSGGDHWLDYVRAVVIELQLAGITLTGANVLIDGDIPLGGGLSSSASLEAAVATALLHLSSGQLSDEELACLCQRAEAEQVGMRCGLMDQYTVCCAQRDFALLLDCRSLEYQQVALPPSMSWLVFNSGVTHSLRDSGYNQRREECMTAVSILCQQLPGIASLRDVSLQQLDICAADLGPVLFRRARHVVTENQRVLDAGGAAEEGDAQQMGMLINQSHASLRFDFEVSCEEVDRQVTMAASCEGVWGARMMGGGFGGCILCLMDAADAEQTEQRVREGALALTSVLPWSHRVTACDGVGALLS